MLANICNSENWMGIVVEHTVIIGHVHWQIIWLDKVPQLACSISDYERNCDQERIRIVR